MDVKFCNFKNWHAEYWNFKILHAESWNFNILHVKSLNFRKILKFQHLRVSNSSDSQTSLPIFFWGRGAGEVCTQAIKFLKFQDLTIFMSNLEISRFCISSLEISKFDMENFEISRFDIQCQILKFQYSACQLLKFQDLTIFMPNLETSKFCMSNFESCRVQALMDFCFVFRLENSLSMSLPLV